MKARYLVRFDDLCPTMCWDVWEEVESIMVQAQIRPILAVIPDNQDAALRVSAANPCFWERVRWWQKQGWTIGLHGYQHRYVTRNAGLVGLNNRSEFAGLSREEQERKLRQAVAIFQAEQVRPDVWVAPAHSFDVTTVAILLEMGVHVISDGFSAYPFRDHRGMLWIPQQFWRFRPMPFGVYTICIHHNAWQPEDVAGFRRDIRAYRDAIVGMEDIVAAYEKRRPGALDALAALLLHTAIKARRLAQG